MSLLNLTAPELRRAADIKDKLETLNRQLAETLAVRSGEATRKPRHWTAAQRRKFIASMRENGCFK